MMDGSIFSLTHIFGYLNRATNVTFYLRWLLFFDYMNQDLWNKSDQVKL